MNKKIRFAGVAALLVMAIMASASQALAQQVRLSARKNKVINGIEAELRGDYREKGSPIRLNAELDNINLPVGTPVAFCVLQNGVASQIGVGKVALIGGIPVAEIELSASDGAVVPNLNAGDVLQARQRKLAPFKTSPTCGTSLLLSAAFQ